MRSDGLVDYGSVVLPQHAMLCVDGERHHAAQRPQREPGAAGAPAQCPHAAGSTGKGGVLPEGQHGHHPGWAFVSGRRTGRSIMFSLEA
jgi:hypothetical protein